MTSLPNVLPGLSGNNLMSGLWCQTILGPNGTQAQLSLCVLGTQGYNNCLGGLRLSFSRPAEYAVWHAVCPVRSGSWLWPGRMRFLVLTTLPVHVVNVGFLGAAKKMFWTATARPITMVTDVQWPRIHARCDGICYSMGAYQVASYPEQSVPVARAPRLKNPALAGLVDTRPETFDVGRCKHNGFMMRKHGDSSSLCLAPGDCRLTGAPLYPTGRYL